MREKEYVCTFTVCVCVCVCVRERVCVHFYGLCMCVSVCVSVGDRKRLHCISKPGVCQACVCVRVLVSMLFFWEWGWGDLKALLSLSATGEKLGGPFRPFSSPKKDKFRERERPRKIPAD